MHKVAEREDDAPELVNEDAPLWDVVNQHAGGALLAINEEREGTGLVDLSDLSIRHAYLLKLGRWGGFRICMTVTEEGETKYVQIDTEVAEDDTEAGVGKEVNSFKAIFNIVPRAILGPEGAAIFEGKNNDHELDFYPCDAVSEGKVRQQLSLMKETEGRATGHIEELAPFKMVDTFRKSLKLTNIPDSYDFYDEYPECKVPVHDQGTCGSCYAFGTLAMIDGRTCKLAIDSGNSHILSSLSDTLSEQDILSCGQSPSTGYCVGMPYIESNGCEGGTAAKVIDFVRDKGVTAEQCFPYTSGGSGTGADHFAVNDGNVPACSIKTCDADDASRNISPPQSCSDGDVACIKAAILHGPVYASVNANDYFKNFETTGITLDRPEDRGHGTNHAITLYGWGSEGGVEYWLAQNSWGTDWGVDGRSKIQIGALGINSGVVWSDPQADADDHYGGSCIKIEENAGTCTFRNECEGVVTASYSWHDVSNECKSVWTASSESFTPGQVRSEENAYGCAVTREEDTMCTNSVPASTKSRRGVSPHASGWSCDDIYGFDSRACDVLTSNTFRPKEVCCSCGGGRLVDIPRPAPREWRRRSGGTSPSKSAQQTQRPTRKPTVATVPSKSQCVDNPDYLFKFKKGKSCAWLARGKKVQFKKRTCNKWDNWYNLPGRKQQVHFWCSKTCGDLGLGPCAN